MHYFRGGHLMSPPRTRLNLRDVATAFVFGAAALASSQYPGQVTKKSKDAAPVLRAIAVLEWTGEEGKPKSSRLVPVTVFDGEALQDGNVYLARPQPLALEAEVEYQLERDGRPIGLFDIKHAGQEQGFWVGYGSWKPLPSAKPRPAKPVLEDAGGDDDKPVLHRKKSGSASGGSETGGSSGPDSGDPSEPSDPDRPTLHKKPASPGSASPDSAGTPGSTPAPEPPSDPDRPVLHNKTKTVAVADDQPSPGYTDPDRPTLKRGKSSGGGSDVLPTLMGLPPEMEQAVAVSDTKTKPEHPWDYSWANPEDELKMKESMEMIAREALGLKAPSAPKHPGSKARPKTALPPPQLPELFEEKFRVFELAYGSGATMVLSARTDGSAAQQKFVTLIAQPDLYGNVHVLFKSVTDGAHLDETPRMRLIDAVDTLADNRGELLFELRGDGQRQFVLYRVLRGTVEKLFETGGGQYGIAGE
jgi:hypothetical protein